MQYITSVSILNWLTYKPTLGPEYHLPALSPTMRLEVFVVLALTSAVSAAPIFLTAATAAGAATAGSVILGSGTGLALASSVVGAKALGLAAGLAVGRQANQRRTRAIPTQFYVIE